MVLRAALEKLMQTLRKIRQWLFGDALRAFGTLSVLLTVSLAIAPASEEFNEWHAFQRGYLRLVRFRADGNSLQRHFQPGLQQIWIPELGVVDRCQTCHVALKEATLSDVSRQPFRPHPPIPHPATKFGCVICHRGQGSATSVEEAHNSTDAWEEPLLPARYLEASCGQCHLNALAGTPKLNQGRTILAAYGCSRCHNITQPDGTKVVATDDPPSLTQIAEKTTREWIYAWIKNPQAYSNTATMPNFQLSEDDARDISAFLIAQSTQPSAVEQKSVATNRATSPAVDAATLYGESFCASCHAVQNAAGTLVGGTLGPELTRIGTKARPEWLQRWLHNPADYDLETRMPHYRFTTAQIEALAGFLEQKTDPDILANVHLTPSTPDQVAHGQKLVTEYGCASCHQIKGIKTPENFAPDLSRVGSRQLAQILFKPGIEHNLPAYIAAKISQPRSFGQSLKMPVPNLTPTQVEAATVALLAQTDRAYALPTSLRVPAIKQTSYEPAGEAGKLIRDLRCFSCHEINGRGGDMAPDLTWEGSSVQEQWLESFLRNPNTLRPALIRRMPKFNLSDSEIKTLSSYIMTVYQTPQLDQSSAPSAADTASVERGRQIFYSKYACQTCHIADYKTDKGYIGPALAEVGSRLTSAWILHYLKDPQKLRPGTLEPDQHISDDDARDLAAFLSTLKSEKLEARR
jgi:mono/diheme cytochrome c family protein